MLNPKRIAIATSWALVFAFIPGGLYSQGLPTSLSLSAMDPMGITALGSVAVFTADDGMSGRELWVSDGTSAGTVMLRDINPGPGHGLLGTQTVFVQSGGVLYFAANDGISGNELWRTDGTLPGTALVADINPGPPSSFPSEIADFFGEVLFQATDGATGAELWKSDGTAPGTQLVLDIFPGQLLFLPPNSSSPKHIFASPTVGLAFFSAFTPGDGEELWITDGTPTGTTLLADLNPGTQPPFNQPLSSGPREFVDYSGLVFFTAKGPDGTELFTTDGTTAALVVDLNLTGDADPRSLIRTPLGLLFTATDGINGRELWNHDGTGIGATLVRELNPTPGESGILGPLYPTSTGIAFAGRTASGQTQLWQSDGSTLGTTPQTSILTSQDGFDPRAITELNGSLYFRVNSESSAHRTLNLWTNRSPLAPATPIGVISLGSNAVLDAIHSDPSSMTTMGSKLFFIGSDSINGQTLWSFDTTSTPAAVAELGEGCGPAGPLARMTSSRPILGQTVTWALFNLSPNRAGDVFITLGSPPSLPIAFGCGVFVSLTPLSPYVPFTTDANGTWVQPFPLPNDPTLIGFPVTFQAAVLGTSAPLGVDLTNGLLFLLGN